MAIDITALYCCLDDFCKVFGDWEAHRLHVAQRLLLLLVQAFTPEGPVIIGLDDTLERRWGAKIKARTN